MNVTFTKGQQVLVYPHGHQDRSATGKVLIISNNQRSIAVGFPDKPPFTVGDVLAIHPEHGITMFLLRGAINGNPLGPWVEAFSGGHYEIEALQ